MNAFSRMIDQAPGRQPLILPFDRLDMLWDRYPQYHESGPFTTLDELLAEHESYRKDFTEDLREEYVTRGYERFLVQLSWNDLAYRQATRRLIEAAGPPPENPYIEAFIDQFAGIDTTRKACFLIPESFDSQFFVISEVCRRAETFHPVQNLFPDEKTIHYLAVFDKKDRDDVVLMHHLDTFGGYSLYDYPLLWYQTHLQQEGTVLRSPYLPDRLSKYLGNLPFCHDPAKTVYVRRNVEHILIQGYFASELDFFLGLTCRLMSLFQQWYEDIARCEEAEGLSTEWRLERTRIRTRLTAEGVIRPKWKHELSLFHALRKIHPDTLYQYRPDWLGRQSLDLYIPSLSTAVEYQGIQHYRPVDFFGGEEALAERQALDERKKQLCKDNHVRLIEWSYETEPTEKNIKKALA